MLGQKNPEIDSGQAGGFSDQISSNTGFTASTLATSIGAPSVVPAAIYGCSGIANF